MSKTGKKVEITKTVGQIMKKMKNHGEDKPCYIVVGDQYYAISDLSSIVDGEDKPSFCMVGEKLNFSVREEICRKRIRQRNHEVYKGRFVDVINDIFGIDDDEIYNKYLDLIASARFFLSNTFIFATSMRYPHIENPIHFMERRKKAYKFTVIFHLRNDYWEKISPKKTGVHGVSGDGSYKDVLALIRGDIEENDKFSVRLGIGPSL